jgi:hypothetical protein
MTERQFEPVQDQPIDNTIYTNTDDRQVYEESANEIKRFFYESQREENRNYSNLLKAFIDFFIQR